MRADLRNHRSPLRRRAAVIGLLTALACLGIGPPASAQPPATDQYVEERPTGPGTDIGTGAPPSPTPKPTVPTAAPPPTGGEQAGPMKESTAAASGPRRRPAEGNTPAAIVRRDTPAPAPAAIPVAEDDGGSGTLGLGPYGVTPFVFCVVAILAACLLWRLGTAGAARLRTG